MKAAEVLVIGLNMIHPAEKGRTAAGPEFSCQSHFGVIYDSLELIDIPFQTESRPR